METNGNLKDVFASLGCNYMILEDLKSKEERSGICQKIEIAQMKMQEAQLWLKDLAYPVPFSEGK